MYEQIGQRIKQIRKEKQLTRKSLSEKTGIPIRTLQRYENCEGDIPLKTLGEICNALEISLTRFLIGETYNINYLSSLYDSELQAVKYGETTKSIIETAIDFKNKTKFINDIELNTRFLYENLNDNGKILSCKILATLYHNHFYNKSIYGIDFPKTNSIIFHTMDLNDNFINMINSDYIKLVQGHAGLADCYIDTDFITEKIFELNFNGIRRMIELMLSLSAMPEYSNDIYYNPFENSDQLQEHFPDSELLDHFHKLNDFGKEKAIDYTSDLTKIPAYSEKNQTKNNNLRADHAENTTEEEQKPTGSAADQPKPSKISEQITAEDTAEHADRSEPSKPITAEDTEHRGHKNRKRDAPTGNSTPLNEKN